MLHLLGITIHSRRTVTIGQLTPYHDLTASYFPSPLPHTWSMLQPFSCYISTGKAFGLAAALI
jgi:hypothetical protein